MPELALSHHQFAALVALLASNKSNAELATVTGLHEHAVRAMMKSLVDRGLVKCLGRPGGLRQPASSYTYRLTAAGRLQAERTQGSLA